MVKKSVFRVVVSALAAVVLIQSLIIIRPFSRRHGVTTPENAVLIARAELIRRYGEEEVIGVEFFAIRIGRYWHVTALPHSYGYPPRVYVNVSSGRAISLWRDGVRNWLAIIIENWRGY